MNYITVVSEEPCQWWGAASDQSPRVRWRKGYSRSQCHNKSAFDTGSGESPLDLPCMRPESHTGRHLCHGLMENDGTAAVLAVWA